MWYMCVCYEWWGVGGWVGCGRDKYIFVIILVLDVRREEIFLIVLLESKY